MFPIKNPAIPVPIDMILLLFYFEMKSVNPVQQRFKFPLQQALFKVHTDHTNITHLGPSIKCKLQACVASACLRAV